MKALVYENYAENDDFESILQIKDVPEPTPKPNDVIFRVKAAALNYDDIWGMRGKPLAYERKAACSSIATRFWN